MSIDYEYGEKPLSLNTRNGTSKKTVRSSYVNIDLNIPRDREGTFEPQSLKNIPYRPQAEKDISSHIKDIYGFSISETMVSRITNKILPTMEEWQNRQLRKVTKNKTYFQMTTYYKKACTLQ
ncbi:transposase [uncultured Anaerococcus sp.]|uniref:transposase n=1 Tax=uncultured Anaerococcus sp. TaxID=293428 RepID=UPI00288C444E|nr:transposase [uncultured Anaerococcus sp.]